LGHSKPGVRAICAGAHEAGQEAAVGKLINWKSSSEREKAVPHLPVPTYRRQDIRERKSFGTIRLRTTCRGGGMADAADLKSSAHRLT
jgi:hypothetical protein